MAREEGTIFIYYSPSRTHARTTFECQVLIGSTSPATAAKATRKWGWSPWWYGPGRFVWSYSCMYAFVSLGDTFWFSLVSYKNAVCCMQELMQKIAAEGGVEALQEYIAQMGRSTCVQLLVRKKRRNNDNRGRMHAGGLINCTCSQIEKCFCCACYYVCCMLYVSQASTQTFSPQLN